MLDIIATPRQDGTYGPKTQRQMEDKSAPLSDSDLKRVSEDVESMSVSEYATKVLDKLYAWRNEDE